MNQTIHSQWYLNFFNGLIVELQKKMSNVCQTRFEAEFIKKHLQLKPGSTIADIPCGDGRLSLALAQHGYHLLGIDISADIIDVAWCSAKTLESNAHFQVGNMLELPWHNNIDGAICFGNSFAYFNHQDNQKFLNGVFKSLKIGGRFILQSNLLAESILTKPLSKTWYRFDDILFLHSASYEAKSSMLTSEYTIIYQHEKETKQAHYHIYRLLDVIELIEIVGFKIINVFGNLQEDDFKLGDLAVYMILEKSK